MSFKNNQGESTLPAGTGSKKTALDFLPKYFRTSANQKFLTATIDQLIDEGEIEKISAFIGRKTAKAYVAGDRYLEEISDNRSAYQLEPAVVIRDSLDNVTFYKNYNDFTNQLVYFNSAETDHSKINSQEYYVWNPHIDWDKFVNYREYYWLPNGPDPISVAGLSKEISSTYTVRLADDLDNRPYIFTPDGVTRNPSLKLYRGQTYRFDINCPGQPIAFSTTRTFLPSQSLIIATQDGIMKGGAFDLEYFDEIAFDVGPYMMVEQTVVEEETGPFNVYDLYAEGVTADSVYVEKGVIEFTVPEDAPNLLYYVSKNDINSSGLIKIYDITENTFIDVEKEIIGKKSYTTSSGVALTNGMKLYFTGEVEPAVYSEGYWYVEGVGTGIILVPEKSLEAPAAFTTDENIDFDNERFDSQGFDVNSNFLGTKDYIMINRSSKDRNPWSRYNRWFHSSVIETAAKLSGQPITLDQTARAARPIIEFAAGLKLFNFGLQAKKNITLVDDKTYDVFSTIEGTSGYYVDGIALEENDRVIFLRDPDKKVNGKVFRVHFYTHINVRRLALIEEDDAEPTIGETVLVLKGNAYRGKMFHYTDAGWVMGQTKTAVNQSPLFDVVDYDGASYSNIDKYAESTFLGTKLFGYRPGTTIDPVLNMGISYRNVGNVGDILFDFYLHTDSFSYLIAPQVNSDTKRITLDNGYLLKHDGLRSISMVNGWTIAAQDSRQPVVRQYEITDNKNNLAIDVYDNSAAVNDLLIDVFVNGLKLQKSQYEINNDGQTAYVKFVNDLKTDDVVILKTVSSEPKNKNGFYEFPLNLERNPLNLSMDSFTLGELINHAQSLADNTEGFVGVVPGLGNLKDLGTISQNGNKIIQHSGPLAIAAYHVTNKKFNVISALRYARKEYSKFKRNFLRVAEDYGFDGDVRRHLDLILLELTKDNTKDMAFYLSDMVPFGSNFIFNQTVIDDSLVEYPLTFDFNLSTASEKAVLVYLNDQQMIHGKDYVFTDYSFVKFLTPLKEEDDIKIVQYEKTDGCFIPPTPTKLGLYPRYQPRIYVDNTYVTPTKVIQGHDGSIMVAFNDYRDDLILELENRIYNNIKVNYDPSVFDIYEFVSGYFRKADIDRDVLNSTLRQDFLNWSSLVAEDYTKNTYFDRDNEFTFNYNQFTAYDKSTPLPGFWRAVYKFAFDTDRPHTHPWEMLGFSEQPSWWIETYGPAPYTSDNLILWSDVKEGIIRKPGEYIVRDEKFARPTILDHIPVDDAGNLLNPLLTGFVTNYISTENRGDYLFGDEAPIETAWRRSSEFPFSLITALTLLRPAKMFATCFDRTRQQRDHTGQIIYKLADGNLRINTKNMVFPNTVKDAQRTFTSGLVNYVVEFAINQSINLVDEYKTDLKNLEVNISCNLAGFVSKEKFRLILDSRNPQNQTSVFIPFEDYEVIMNTSSPVDSVVYSGVIIEKQASGFIINGYNRVNPEFKYYKPLDRSIDPVINVGGISESFVDWKPGKLYARSQVVSNESKFYRVITTHESGAVFDSKYYAILPELPIEGGRNVILRRTFEETESSLHYGSKIETVQEVIDFLLGYERWLQVQGFDFNYFNSTIETVTNWQYAVKEFAFWTTQQWGVGALIALSPGADEISFNRSYAVVDNIFDNFYEYTLYKQDGSNLDPAFLTNSVRDGNTFAVKPRNTADGIYHVELNLVQKEHVLLLKNKTVFNDIIYDQKQGYRQERIKVLGYRTKGWNGSFDTPGFVYDQARIFEWAPWTDYSLGDTVKHKEFYYGARKNVPGAATFNDDDWYKLPKKPETKLIPNFDFQARQFLDFYDLDTQGFEADQQQVAQHLIGYQKRQYLENIINDETSQYKFYQGMIREKGTKNSLTKLFDVFGESNKNTLEFYEEWAIRLGQYGGSDSFDEIEYKLDEKKFLVNPQPIELVGPTQDLYTEDFVYRFRPTDVYIKPKNYNHNPLPTTTEYIEFVKTAGYVTKDDVKSIVKDYSGLLDLDFSDFIPGDYVWIETDKISWNVYRFNSVEETITSAVDNGTTFDISLENSNKIKVNDLVIIKNLAASIDGYYQVKTVSENNFTVDLSEPYANEELTISSASVVVLTSHKISSIYHYDRLGLLEKKDEELFWIDDPSERKWFVVKYDDQYAVSSFLSVYNSDTNNNFKDFSKNIAVANNNQTLLVQSNSANNYQWVYVLTRSRENQQWNYAVVKNSRAQYAITAEDWLADGFDTAGSLGDTMAVSDDGEYLIVSAPSSSVVGIANCGVTVIYKKIVTGTEQYFIQDSFKAPTAIGPNRYFGFRVATAGELVAIASKGSADSKPEIIVVNLLTGKTIFTTSSEDFNFGEEILDISFNREIIVATTSNNKIKQWETTSDDSLYAKSSIELPTTGTLTTFNGRTVLVNESSSSGQTLALSRDGKFVAVGAPTYNGNKGLIAIYKIVSGRLILNDFLTSPNVNSSANFGSKIKFSSDSSQLVVYDKNTGTLIFDLIDDTFIYSKALEISDTNSSSYGNRFDVTDRIYLNDPGATLGRVFECYSPINTWSVYRQSEPVVDLSRIKSIFLYNSATDRIVKNLDYIDVRQGKIIGLAEQELSFKTPFDPATYTHGSTQVIVDRLAGWKEQNVGKLWWDIGTSKWLDPYQGPTMFKANTWNSITDNSEIAIYEWIQTEYLPSEWSSLADTESGLAMGISGTPRYGDDVYSLDQKYDNVSKTFKNVYYYWVKNKKIAPNTPYRKLSADKVARYIANPKNEGEPYVILMSSNQFALVNCKDLLVNNDVVLNIRYWITDNTELNVHRHYQLLAEGDMSRKINSKIEQKWFDSLVGYDSQGNEVPDQSLPEKLKYGVMNDPRQSMFKDRRAAIEQFIVRLNSVLIENMLIDDFNFDLLNSKEPMPSDKSNLYDAAVDTYADIRFVSITKARRARVKITIRNGRVATAEIADSGYGYKVPPKLVVIGPGVGAKLSAELSPKGEITKVVIDNPGDGYNDLSAVSIRPFTVLVRADENTKGKWALYALEQKTWTKIRNQGYDVTRVWSYVDWYAPGYSMFTRVDHSVDFAYQLPKQDIKVGETVKINNHNGLGWILLEKIDTQQTLETVVNYKTVGRENGTIQFNSNLYSFEINSIGFDILPYDGGLYDEIPIKELEIILKVIRDSLLVNNLEEVYYQLFFSSIRYAFTEQNSIDWAFKTSFIKSKHNLGALTQKIVYQNDNIESYEEYINEVKPYRTKIREFISAYTRLETSNLGLTDFDFPARYDWLTHTIQPLVVTVGENGIEYDRPDVFARPYSDWYNNAGNWIDEIVVTDSGNLYKVPPVVEITGLCKTPARARAYLSNGKVANIVVEYSGEGYLTTPTVRLIGSTLEGGAEAKAVAIVAPTLVRNSKIGIKFDRTAPIYQITDLNFVEEFEGTGSKTRFVLRWPVDIRINTMTVIISNDEILKSDYTVVNELDKTSKYTRFFGVLTFTVPPSSTDKITIKYQKDPNLLNGPDRVLHFYQPDVGQTGKDLGQLMQGVDYGGVQISGMDFDIGAGWDALPWMKSGWDYVDKDYTDHLVISDGSTRSFMLPYVPAQGEIININFSGYRDTFVGEGTALSGSANGKTIVIAYVPGIVEGLLIDGYGVQNDTYILDTFFSVGTATVILSKPIVKDASGMYGFYRRDGFSRRLDDINYREFDLARAALTELENQLASINRERIALEEIACGNKEDLDSLNRNILLTNQRIEAIDAEIAQKGDDSLPCDTGETLAEQRQRLLSELASYESRIPANSLLFEQAQEQCSVKCEEYAQAELNLPALRAAFDQAQSRLTNLEAVMESFVGDGESSGPIEIPETVDLEPFDKIFFRKNTSDGSFRPDENYYDTDLSGGDLEFGTAKGLQPEEIIVDGDGFVTPDTSHAPEEMVPGQVFDTMDIQVYQRVGDGAPVIGTCRYTGDGVTRSFKFSPRANTIGSVIVFVDGLLMTNEDEYKVVYSDQTVYFFFPPADGQSIVINTFSQNGNDLLDLDYFVADGITQEFISGVRWSGDHIAFVTVNGIPAAITTFITDDTYENVGNIGIRFPTAPDANAIVNYTIMRGFYDSISKANVEVIVHNGESNSYSLNFVPKSLEPISNSVLVEIEGQILKPQDTLYYDVIGNNRTFSISTSKYAVNSLENDDIEVYCNDKKLELNADYTWIAGANQLRIRRNSAKSGDRIKVTIKKTAQYIIESNGIQAQIVLTEYWPANTVITVTSFSNHDILNIEREGTLVTTESQLTPGTVEYYKYNALTDNRIKLTNPAIAEQYVWVVLNGKLLTPRIDYVIEINQMWVQIDRNIKLSDSDTVEIIAFSSRITKPPFGYRIFKDMLNKTVYKRFDDSTSTVLIEPLNFYDHSITVEDASGLQDPVHLDNNPGVVFIEGERIEYYKKEGNVLARIHRGTMGTGIKSVYEVGTKVMDQSSINTVPYKDELVISKQLSNGRDKLIPIDFIPKITAKTVAEGNDWFRKTIPESFGQCDEIEVFVGGRRLRKHPDYIWNSEVGPDSPIGDVMTDAEFSVEKPKWINIDESPNALALQKMPIKVVGTLTNEAYLPQVGENLGDAYVINGKRFMWIIPPYVRLTEVPPEGTLILVQKKIGKTWTDPGQSLADATSFAAEFIRAKPAYSPDKPVKYNINVVDQVIDLENDRDSLDDESGNALEWT